MHCVWCCGATETPKVPCQMLLVCTIKHASEFLSSIIGLYSDWSLLDECVEVVCPATDVLRSIIWKHRTSFSFVIYFQQGAPPTYGSSCWISYRTRTPVPGTSNGPRGRRASSNWSTPRQCPSFGENTRTNQTWTTRLWDVLLGESPCVCVRERTISYLFVVVVESNIKTSSFAPQIKSSFAPQILLPAWYPRQSGRSAAGLPV